MDKNKISKIIIAVILVVTLGPFILPMIIIGGVGVWQAIDQSAAINSDTAIEVMGTIVDYDTEYKKDGSVYNFAIYEYEIDGKTYTHRSVHNTQDVDRIGDQVKLYYDTETGVATEADSAKKWGGMALAALGFIIIFSVFKFLSVRQRIVNINYTVDEASDLYNQYKQNSGRHYTDDENY